MTLSEQINNDFIEALKNRDSEKLSVLRMLKSSIKNSEIALKKTLDDPEVVKILQREVKQRKDSIESFSSAGREQLAEKEEKEIKYLEKYLPEQLSDDDLTAILETVITETGAKSMADLGRVMASAMPKVSGRADGSAVSEKAKELLTK